ncbi:glycosyltransferase family 39 protein [Kamptonema cortianum]|nr:glycosyltransferase family 39 protein [Oscillatoria laete-virens]MDK3159347.1 glycosyltransferase family 39 protein [Kamptonema cortianum]MDL5054972.1 glycosyltransferase family 39 protein [Oscillatoria laete-virens NRMC-F 0139]
MRTPDRISWIALICLGYLFVAVVYSVTIPAFEVSDELWHYPMVDYLASSGLQLPVQDPQNVALWRQEGSQPPLYYMMSALLVAGIDRTDLQEVRRPNPHADIGVIHPDGNANMMVRSLDRGGFSTDGTLFAVQVVRWFSVLLGLGTVLVTYHIGRELFPDQPVIALGAAGLTAFLPMFLFISASVNNDNLSNLLGNLLTLLTIRLMKRQTLPTWRTYAVIGVVIGAGLLAKLNLGFWMPVLGTALLLNSIRLKDWRSFLVGGSIIAVLAVLIAGWWYLRNWQLYGEPTGLNVFLDIVGRRAIYANPEQLWSERVSFTRSFWGLFGGMNVPMSDALYVLLDTLGLIGLIGAVAFIFAALLQRRYSFRGWLPFAVTLIWPVVTFISLLRWTAETPASQGRLIFGALSSIAFWLMVGWVWWQPKQWRPITTVVLVSGLALIAVSTPFTVIQPAYAAPETVTASRSQLAQFRQPADTGTISLVETRILTPEVRPETYAELEIVWQIDEPLKEDWSLFVHLVSPEGVTVAQRDVLPGQGRLATSELAASYAWRNPVSVWLPSNVYAPNELTVEMGWYHAATGQRLILPDGATTFRAGVIHLLPRLSRLNVPNPISVNFDHQVELVGYEVSTLAPQPGETVELTLYWRRLRAITRDYTVFAHIVDPATQTLYAGSDAQPVQGTRPMTTWTEGEIIADSHRLIVSPNALAGIYELEIGVYTQTLDGAFSRLQVIASDRGMANDFAYLSRIRIGSAPISEGIQP